MYLPASGNIIYEYEFGTAGDVSTITYTGRSLNVSGDLPSGTTVIGVSVSPDNEHMVCMARDPLVAGNNYVLHYTRAPILNVSGMGFISNLGNPEPILGLTRRDWDWKSDGTRTWMWRNDGIMWQYDVSPAWSVTPGGAWTTSASPNIGTTNARSFQWSPDGTKLLTLQRTGGLAHLVAYDQSATPWDVTVLGASSTSVTFPINDTEMHWKPDGSVVYIVNAAGIINAYAISPAFDVTSLVYTPIQTFDPTIDAPLRRRTMAFSADGSKLYSFVSDGAGAENLCEWTLSTPYDVSTAGNFVVGPDAQAQGLPQIITPIGLYIRRDNGYAYIARDVHNTTSDPQSVMVFG